LAASADLLQCHGRAGMAVVEPFILNFELLIVPA
jgi:hypothetical protein